MDTSSNVRNKDKSVSHKESFAHIVAWYQVRYMVGISTITISPVHKRAYSSNHQAGLSTRSIYQQSPIYDGIKYHVKKDDHQIQI